MQVSKVLVFGTLALSALAVVAGPKKNAVLEKYRAKQGGFLERPDSLKGKIAFIDTQDAVKGDVIKKAIERINAGTEFNLAYNKVQAGKPGDLLRDSGANLAVVVIADDTTPAMLVAPEERWAVVNARKTKSDEITRKEIMRAFSLLCGGGSSQFPGGLFNKAKLEDVEECDEAIPTDLLNAHKDYLKQLGVTPKMRSSYKVAVREGWAPEPTNDIQKAIWDQLHQLPSNPIKIKYDPKKGE